MAIQTDVMVVLEDRPGLMARVGEALGDAGINIQGVCALASRGEGLIHVLVDDGEGEAAGRALASSGLEVHTMRDVWVEQCPDRPGELGRMMRRLAGADLNLDLVYMTTTGRIVIGAENLDRISTLLS
ncbi:MAG TPA: ACT domain-containing protein [Candidatus Dormibacteraeota bacterium]